MNLHQLKLFCTVVEMGSFALAGERLHITQPALSIQVRRLEQSLGVELLKRTKKGLVLTAEGKTVYDSAKGIFERQEGMERRLQEIRSGQAGTIVVAVSPSGVLYFVSSLIRAFKRQFPTTEIIPRVGKRQEVLDLVAQGVVDLGFEWGPIDHARLSATALTQVRFQVVLNPEHPLSVRKAVPVKDFIREPFIDLDHGPGTPSFVEESLLRAGIRPKTVVRMPSIDAVKRAIEADLGIGMLSNLSVERELQWGLLKVLPLERFPLSRDLVVVSGKDGPASTLAKTFLKFAGKYATSPRP